MFKIFIAEDRIFGLDILRAFAILFVIYGHSIIFLSAILPAPILSFFELDGVTIFFVLSGFLIGTILIKTTLKEKSDKNVLFNFWVRRWFRTLPNYFLILILLIFVNGNFNYSTLKYFLFLQNFNYPHPFFFSEAWSLAVEEWFYILIPIFIFFVLKIFQINEKKAFFSIIIFVILGVTIYRIFETYLCNFTNLDIWDLNLRKEVITRLDSIMYGVLGAFLSIFYKKYWIKWKKFCICLGLTLLLIIQLVIVINNIKIDQNFEKLHVFMNSFYFPLQSLSVLLLLPFLSDFKFIFNKYIYRVITLISIISYSMYLINYSIIYKIIIPKLSHNFLFFIKGEILSIVQFILFWILTILGSVLLYKYYENPMMKLREKFR